MKKILAQVALVMLVLAAAARLELTLAAQQLSAADAKTWLGEWTLTLQGGRGPLERTLTIRQTDGKVTATLAGVAGAPIEVTDVSKKDEDLILKYRLSGRGGGPDIEATMTLTMQPDGGLGVVNQVAGNKQEGTGRRRCPPDCRK